MEKHRRKMLADIEAAMAFRETGETDDTAAGSISDLIGAILKEPNKKARKKLISEFTARHKDAADFLSENEELIIAEAEAALISSSVGGTVTDKKVSYKGGRKNVEYSRRRIPPNISSLAFLLKNKAPDRYSDKPAGGTEIEDVSEIKEDIENAGEESDESG